MAQRRWLDGREDHTRSRSDIRATNVLRCSIKFALRRARADDAPNDTDRAVQYDSVAEVCGPLDAIYLDDDLRVMDYKGNLITPPDNEGRASH